MEFFAGVLASAEEQIRVRVGVIADEVAAGGDFFCEVRALADKFADSEERGFYVVLREQLQQLWRDRRIGPIVKCQRQFVGRMGVPDRGAEELRTRKSRAVKSYSRQPCRNRGRHANQPGIHAEYCCTRL